MILVYPLLSFNTEKQGIFANVWVFLDKWGLFFQKLSIFRRNWGISPFLDIFPKKQKKIWKFMNRLKILTQIVNNWSCVSIFQYKFPFITLVSPIQKIRFNFENTSFGISRSVIPRWRENRKTQVALNFLIVATHFYPRRRGSYFSFRSQLEVFYYWKCTLF